MISNHLLETKYKVQKQLELESDHNLKKYVHITSQIVKKVENEYGLKFKYGTIQGGYFGSNEIEDKIA